VTHNIVDDPSITHSVNSTSTSISSVPGTSYQTPLTDSAPSKLNAFSELLLNR